MRIVENISIGQNTFHVFLSLFIQGKEGLLEWVTVTGLTNAGRSRIILGSYVWICLAEDWTLLLILRDDAAAVHPSSPRGAHAQSGARTGATLPAVLPKVYPLCC